MIDYFLFRSKLLKRIFFFFVIYPWPYRHTGKNIVQLNQSNELNARRSDESSSNSKTFAIFGKTKPPRTTEIHILSHLWNQDNRSERRNPPEYHEVVCLGQNLLFFYPYTTGIPINNSVCWYLITDKRQIDLERTIDLVPDRTKRQQIDGGKSVCVKLRFT